MSQMSVFDIIELADVTELVNQHRYSEARPRLEALLGNNPNDPSVKELLARCTPPAAPPPPPFPATAEYAASSAYPPAPAYAAAPPAYINYASTMSTYKSAMDNESSAYANTGYAAPPPYGYTPPRPVVYSYQDETRYRDKPWYFSFGFKIFAFLFFTPLWVFLVLADKDSSIIVKVIAILWVCFYVYLIFSIFSGSQYTYYR